MNIIEQKIANDDLLENMAFERLKKILSETLGVQFSGYRDEYLKRRISIRLRATNTNKYLSYISYIKKNPEEVDNLFNDLTINYTSFFRDSDVYNYLEKKIFPKIFESDSVRIWSAGCASGEEPYSLAILVNKAIDLQVTRKTPSNAIIFATDVDKDALAKASLGEYKKTQLQTLDEASIDKYFTKEGEIYRVKDCLRRYAKFENADIMKPPAHTNLDLILCRNVMIYFLKESQQVVHMHFFNALKEGGFFVGGKAEILSGEPSQKFVQYNAETRVYIKPKANSVPAV